MKKKEFTLAFVIAAVLRVYQLGAAGYWYDEGFTVTLSRMPIMQMIDATAGDVHPPFFYILSWLTARISTAEWVMRFPSAIFSLLAVYLTWKLVKVFELTRWAQIAVVSWVVIAPIQMHYAQEVRMYALLQLEVLLLIFLLFKREWVWFSVVALLTLYTHNYALFYLPTLAVIALVKNTRDWKGPITYPIAFLVPGVLWLPWAFVILNQMQTIGSTGYWIQPPTVASIFFTFYQLLFAYSMPLIFQGIAVIVMVCMLFITGYKFIQSPPENWFYLVLLVLMPMALSLAGSMVWESVFLFRGFIGCSVPLVILMVMGIEQIRTKYKRIYLYAVIASVLVAGTTGHYLYNVSNKGDTVDWISRITDQWQEGDAILSLNDNGVIAVNTYAPGYPYFKVPSCGQDALGSLSPHTRQAIGAVEKDIAEIDADRIWYISTIAPVSPLCEEQETKRIIEDYDAVLVEKLADSEYREAGVYLIDG